MNPDMNQGAGAPEKEPVGALISIIIVAILLVIGGYYAFRNVPAPENIPSVEAETDPLVIALSKQSTSDEIVDIQRDIALTPDLSIIGAGLDNIQL